MSLLRPSQEYSQWLADIKQHIQSAQQHASLTVNRELVLLYWHIGRDILERQQAQGWGAKVIEQLAKNLTAAFPRINYYYPRKIIYIWAIHEIWPNEVIVQQLIGQLFWGQQSPILLGVGDE
jgi:hypothetical protein